MGFRDVVAPPTFAVVFCRTLHPGIFDPELGIDYDQMLHGGQEFVFGEPVCSGDVITTAARVSDVYEKGALTFFVFESSSRNQLGATVVEGTWTMIVREG
jgi:acyl dehydratase